MVLVTMDHAAIEAIDKTEMFDRFGAAIARDANHNAHVVTGRLSGRLRMGILSGYQHIATREHAVIFTWVPYAMAEEMGAVHETWIQEAHPHFRPAIYTYRTVLPPAGMSTRPPPMPSAP